MKLTSLNYRLETDGFQYLKVLITWNALLHSLIRPLIYFIISSSIVIFVTGYLSCDIYQRTTGVSTGPWNKMHALSSRHMAIPTYQEESISLNNLAKEESLSVVLFG